jgi:predicted pyridoxine 5'-phosphate oxidase superfamily flavin-nucleotide-binding protein
MGRTYDSITPQALEWIERQQMFFVATAPLDTDGHVNVSPKGLDTLRVLDDHTVAYLDLTGSGAETAAHLRENGRVTLMWCAFDGPPRIVRVHGRGEYVPVDDERVAGRFTAFRGARGVVIVHADRISDSCGYSVPLYEYQGQRSRLTEWADHKTDEELVAYRVAKNATSIDGLPAIEPLLSSTD